MSVMTSHERFERMYGHEEADRIPIIDGPWDDTIKRWNREGMPENIDFRDYFDLDKVSCIKVDNSPRYPSVILEETEDYIVQTTCWGTTLKNWKHVTSTPEFVDFSIVDPDSWREAKKRMTPSSDRVQWASLEANYRKWRDEGHWIVGNFWFGFDVTHSWMVGTETLLMAMMDEPEWCVEMFDHFLDLDIAMFETVLDRGYEIDCISWPDDMGYCHNQFFSVGMYRELLKPVHKRAIDWAHGKGIKAHMHSCGDVNPFLPELVEIGLDAINPMEVKAGMDPIGIKRKYGKDLVLHGGINAVLWDDPEAICEEMERVLPIVKESGGYIFSSDHSVPSTVCLQNFRFIIEQAKRLGRY